MSAGETLVDRELPGLPLLLADEPLRSWLAHYGQVLERRYYLRYKPGTSCVAGLRLESGPALLLTVSASVLPKLDKFLLKARPGLVLAHDPDRRLLLASFAADRDLPAVRDLPKAVGSLLPEGLDERSIRTLVYKPQRRWVGLVQAADEHGSVLLRAYRPPDVAGAVERLKVAQRVGNAVRVPRLLSVATHYAVMAVEYLPGAQLDGDLRNGSMAGKIAAAGEALARVHQIDATGIPPADVSRSSDTASLVGALLPCLAERVANVSASLERRRPVGADATLCHGDFSLDQVVIAENGHVALIDWDRAGYGSPAADLASAAAAGLDEQSMKQLLAGYTRIQPLPANLSWHLANAHLQRLAEPFRNASPSWAEEISTRLTRLEASLL